MGIFMWSLGCIWLHVNAGRFMEYHLPIGTIDYTVRFLIIFTERCAILFVHFLKDSRNFQASLGTFAGTRIMMTDFSTYAIKTAITIAIRYSAVRKQFGPTAEEELPVLEYQMQVQSIRI